MSAPTVSDYALQLLKPNGLTQSTVNPMDYLNALAGAQSQTTSRPRLDPLDVALTGRMRSDVGMLESASKNMTQGGAAMKTTLEPLTRVQTLLGEMANLTAQAGVAYNSNKMDEYESFKTQYEARAQEVSGLVQGTSFNGISLMDGAGWQSPNSSITANYTEVTDPDTGEVTRTYSGTGTLGIQAGKSTMKVQMIDFGATAAANGHSLVNLTNDVPWLQTEEFQLPTALSPDATPEQIAEHDAAMLEYRGAVKRYSDQNGLNLTDEEIEDYVDPVTINTGKFDTAADKLFELQGLVGVAIARYGAYSSSMSRQEAMFKGQADIVKQAVTNQLSGSSDIESMTLDMLRSSIISGRG